MIGAAITAYWILGSIFTAIRPTAAYAPSILATQTTEVGEP
jgi:hypothetical protein